jgi:hypothetical protein
MGTPFGRTQAKLPAWTNGAVHHLHAIVSFPLALVRSYLVLSVLLTIDSLWPVLAARSRFSQEERRAHFEKGLPRYTTADLAAVAFEEKRVDVE